jgi:hypothetical protein
LFELNVGCRFYQRHSVFVCTLVVLGWLRLEFICVDFSAFPMGNFMRYRCGCYRWELAIQLLLAHGADPKEGGRTLLDLASKEGHLEVVQGLLALRENVHVRDDQGLTPFHWQVAPRNRERGSPGIIARARCGGNIGLSCPRLSMLASALYEHYQYQKPY